MNSLPRRILVVDDDPVIRNLICTLLTRRQHGCAQAANGEEVVTLFTPDSTESSPMPYDLVILDMMMPLVSGWDVLETVERELPDFKKHIIIVSAAGAQLDELRSKGYGAIIEKPFDTAELYDAVDRCLRGPHAVNGPWQGEGDVSRKMEI